MNSCPLPYRHYLLKATLVFYVVIVTAYGSSDENEFFHFLFHLHRSTFCLAFNAYSLLITLLYLLTG